MFLDFIRSPINYKQLRKYTFIIFCGQYIEALAVIFYKHKYNLIRTVFSIFFFQFFMRKHLKRSPSLIVNLYFFYFILGNISQKSKVLFKLRNPTKYVRTQNQYKKQTSRKIERLDDQGHETQSLLNILDFQNTVKSV